jgi:uncharacterized membrane protein (DUF373 family)
MGPGFENDEALVLWLRRGIKLAVRVLAILMLLVIWWGVADVIYVLYNRVAAHPYYLLNISDILATFGAFMAVLIAIEIFVNITSYLRDNIIHIKIVLATALLAIARKVIVLDYKEVAPEYIYATALVVAALSLAYWLVVVKNPGEKPQSEL